MTRKRTRSGPPLGGRRLRPAGPSCPRRGGLRRVLRLAGWNALLLIAGLALIGLAGETRLRLKGPFMTVHYSDVFVADVGLLLRPRTEVRWTNRADFWTVSRTNSLGFPDREPPSPARAAESCHIAVIGDSFVDAREVPISEKFHVRLEEMAARELPALDVTTSAFGKRSTGQINQLAWYDQYVRHLRPRVVVLVFVPNDFVNNFPILMSLTYGFDPDHWPYVSAERAEDGGFRLRPPDPDYRRFRLPILHPPVPQWRSAVERSISPSWFWTWLNEEGSQLTGAGEKLLLSGASCPAGTAEPAPRLCAVARRAATCQDAHATAGRRASLHGSLPAAC